MKYPYRCKKCNSISVVDKPIKLKAKFEYCGHCKSREPLVVISDSFKIKRIKV